MPPVSCSILPFVMRETQQDWLSPTGTLQLQNTSLVLRPGAMTQDYLTAFSYGPLEIGFTDSGSVARVWRARNVDTGVSSSVRISAAAISAAGYTTESALFTFVKGASGSIRELDLAFDSAGRASIAAERSGSAATGTIWLYWFNGILSQFVFQQFATGSRSPRLVLDNPEDTPNSDLLLFYVDGLSGSLLYRQQRDAYAIPYRVPLPQTLNLTGSASGVFFLAQVTGSVSGNGTGSFRSMFPGDPFSWYLGRLDGRSVSGTFNGWATSSFNTIESVSNVTFIGSISGTYTGSWSGSGVNNVTGAFSGAALTGSFFGLMTGLFRNTPTVNFATGTIVRPRSGSFNHNLMIGQFSGSFTGSELVEGIMSSSVGLTTARMSGMFDGTLLENKVLNFAAGTMSVDVVGGFSGPFSLWRETYLEDVVKLRDSRVGVYYSRRDPTTDKWTTNRYDSILYPIRNLPADSFIANASLVSASIRTYVITQNQTGSLALRNNFVVGESFQSMSVQYLTGSLNNIVIEVFQTGSLQLPNNVVVGEAFQSMSTAYITGTLVDFILGHIQSGSTTETLWSGTLTLPTSSRNEITIVHNVFDKDTLWSGSLTFITGSRT